MQKVRIRISDGSLQWVPMVAVIRDGIYTQYYRFLSGPSKWGMDKVYVFLHTHAVNGGYCSNIDLEEAEAMEPCSVEEFNAAVDRVANHYKIHE